MVKLCWLPSIGSVFRLEASLRPCASSIGKRTMVAVVTVTTRTMTTLIPEMIAGICGQSFNHCSLQHRIYLNYNRYNINHPNYSHAFLSLRFWYVLVAFTQSSSLTSFNIYLLHLLSPPHPIHSATAYLKSPGISPAQ